jgi:hypothetical protein
MSTNKKSDTPSPQGASSDTDGSSQSTPSASPAAPKKKPNVKWSKELDARLLVLREQRVPWMDVATTMAKQFNMDVSQDACRNRFKKINPAKASPPATPDTAEQDDSAGDGEKKSVIEESEEEWVGRMLKQLRRWQASCCDDVCKRKDEGDKGDGSTGEDWLISMIAMVTARQTVLQRQRRFS